MKKDYKFLPYDPRLTNKARENRHRQTYPEKMMWLGLLRDREFEGLKFIRQKPIGRFIVDFYCAELMLAVEIDGCTHDGQKEYDDERTEKLKTFGITVVRYSNDDVLENLDGVHVDLKQIVDSLRREMGKKSPLSPPAAPACGEAARDRLLPGGQIKFYKCHALMAEWMKLLQGCRKCVVL